MHKSWQMAGLLAAATFAPLAALSFLALRAIVNEGPTAEMQLFSGIYEDFWGVTLGFLVATSAAYILARDRKLLSVLLAWALVAIQVALVLTLISFI